MSEISELKRQFSEGKWKKFIKEIKITNLHGWDGKTIKFNFPVCAIVGENGVGKSTYIKAAACAYQNVGMKSYYPSNLFVRTQWDGNSVNNALLEFVIQEGDRIRNVKWKKTNDWGYTPKSEKPKRRVYFLDVSRTLPLDATAGYAKIAKQAMQENENVNLNDESIRALSYIMNKTYSAARFASTDISTKEVGLLTNSFGEVSQFHQGAGEDATLDLFRLIQDIPEQSLLIIDEVEASLHPQAQRRLVRHLIKIARKNKLQIIMSTHSAFVLEELPEEGRIMLIQSLNTKEILYNISVKFALSSIDDKDHPELFIFVEDEEAERLIYEIIKASDECDNILRRVVVKPIGSYTVVNAIGALLKENKLPYKGVGIVDGDKSEECINNCLSLPGDLPPEKMIIQDMKELNWNNLENRFGLGAGSLFKILNDSVIIEDHHKWTEEIGNKIKMSKDNVWSIFVEEWCKQCLDNETKEELVTKIYSLLS